ncbi:MAG: TolC family protein [Marinilabilia sp.]
MKQIITSFIAIFLSLPLISQNQEPAAETWTLEEVLREAERNNWELRKSESRIDQEKAEYRSTHSTFLPRVSVSQSVTHTNDPLAAFGMKLQQEIVTQEDFNPALLNDPDEITNFHTQVLVEQPLLNTDALAGRKAASHKLEAVKHQDRRSRHYVRYLVKQSYYAIQLALEQEKVIRDALEAAKENLRIAKDNLEADYITKADVMAVRVRVLDLESQLTNTSNKVTNAGERLAYLLGRNDEGPIMPSEELTRVAYTNPSDDNFELRQRSDLLAMENASKARHSMVKMQKLKMVPRVNAFGAFNMHDADFAGNDAQNLVIGAKLEWDLFSGNKNLAGIKKASAQASLAKIKYNEHVNKSRMELAKARREVSVAEETLEARSMAVKEAEESLRIRRDQYKQGLEKTSELLTAEATFSAKKLLQL